MALKSAGSVYHLSSLRYAEGSRSIQAPSHLSSVAQHPSRSRLDELFEQAEDDYRPGQSSSSSLLIRSNVLSIDAPPEDQSEARDGFLRTKARSILAQSIPNGDMAEDDALLGVHISELGSSIYLRNRRAKNPMTRASYDRLRTKKREIRERAKARKLTKFTEEGTATPADEEEDAEEREQQKIKAERIKMEMQADADLLACLLPSGSLMETIHYLAAHYYDARGLLSTRDGTAPKKLLGANMWRVGESSALVALAIYLEEVAKFESAAGQGQGTHQESNSEGAKEVGEKLAKLQQESIKSMRRKRGKRLAGRGARKLIANGWARDRRRKRTNTAARLESTESDSDAEEEEEEDLGMEEASNDSNETGVDEE